MHHLQKLSYRETVGSMLIHSLLSFLPTYFGSLTVALLSIVCGGCQQKTAETPIAQQPVRELKFDPRYIDSISMPKRSARTERELAIYQQLDRLNWDKTTKHLEEKFKLKIPRNPHDSVFEKIGDGPMRGYADSAAYMADVHRKLDSLKVLEHIPLTPY